MPRKIREERNAYQRSYMKKNRKRYTKKSTAATAKWKKNNLEAAAIIRRRHYLKREFGITLEDYENLLIQQNHSCAICGKHRSEFARELSLDHDHQTKEIRGALCYNCNRNLIGHHREASLLYKGARYLEGPFTGWFVPNKKLKRKRKK